MIIGRVVTIKRLYAYITGKSVKQRICIGIVAAVMLMLIFFTIKANCFDVTVADSGLPPFRISLIDVGILLAVIAAYCIHKIREKKKQGRL